MTTTRRTALGLATAAALAGPAFALAPAAQAAPAHASHAAHQSRPAPRATTSQTTYGIGLVSDVKNATHLAVQDDTHDIVAAVREDQEPYGTHVHVIHRGRPVSDDYLGPRTWLTAMDSADSTQVWLAGGDGRLWLRTPSGLTTVDAPTAPEGQPGVTAIHDVPGPDVLVAVGATVYRGRPGSPWTALGGPGGTPADATVPGVPMSRIDGIDDYRGIVYVWGTPGPGARKTAFTYDGTTWTRGATVNENYGPLSVDVYRAFVPMGGGRLEAFGSTTKRGGTAQLLHSTLLGTPRSYGLDAPISTGGRVGDSGVLMNIDGVYQVRQDGTASKVAGPVPGYQYMDSVLASSEDGSVVVAGTSTGIYGCAGPVAH